MIGMDLLQFCIGTHYLPFTIWRIIDLKFDIYILSILYLVFNFFRCKA